METKKYRFTTIEVGRFRVGTPVNVDNFDEFIDYLNEKGFKRVTFKYRTIIDDIPEWLKDSFYLQINDIQPWQFEWLVTKAYGQFKFLEIDLQVNKP